MSDFTEYRERIAAGENAFLGRLCWYSVSEDVRIEHEEAFKLLVRANLGAFVPKAPADTDVFRRVTTAAARKRQPTTTPGVFENYLIRDIPMDKQIVRRVVRERVDSNNVRLGYDEVAEISFTKGSGQLVCQHLINDPISVEICEAVKRSYANERNKINSYGIRALIRDVLTGCNATNVRYPSGGVYFVNEDYIDKLLALEKLANKIGDGISVHILPLIDDRKQREMLKRAFEAESVDAIDALLTEITQLKNDNKKISKDKYAAYVTQLNDLNAKAKEYSDLLETGLHSTSSRLKIFKQAVVGLRTQVN